jgi:hypothetical protein
MFLARDFYREIPSFSFRRCVRTGYNDLHAAIKAGETGAPG